MTPRLTAGCGIARTRLPVALCALVTVSTARAVRGQQDTARAALVGDGLLHGAPVRPVSDALLVPGQVQQLNLHPRMSVTLLLPYPIDHLSGGDADVFKADAFRSDLTLVPTAITARETNFQIHFQDPTHAPVAFRVRVDTTQPAADLIRYVDPVDRYLRRVRADYEAALRADDERLVRALATGRIERLMLLAGPPRWVDRAESDRQPDGVLDARVETVQSVPGEDGRPHLWVRYTVTNRTGAALTDLVTVADIVTRTRRWVFFERRRTRELAGTRDIRTTEVVPPGASVRGLLMLDDVPLTRHESLALEITAARTHHRVRIDHVLAGH